MVAATEVEGGGNFLRLQTPYAQEELPFPECFEGVVRLWSSRAPGLQDLKSEGLNVMRRLGEIDLFAWHIEQATLLRRPEIACPLVSAYLAAYFGSFKALFDAAALFLNSLHHLALPPKKQDLRLGEFWTTLQCQSVEAHKRYGPFNSVCLQVVRWRDAAVHRAAPFAILHLSNEDRDQWRPENGAIKVVDDPDWRGGRVRP